MIKNLTIRNQDLEKKSLRDYRNKIPKDFYPRKTFYPGEINSRIEGILHGGTGEGMSFLGDFSAYTYYRFTYQEKNEDILAELILPSLTGVLHSGAKAGDSIAIEKADNVVVISITRPFDRFNWKNLTRYRGRDLKHRFEFELKCH